MKKSFLQVIKSLHHESYVNTLDRIIREKIPCAIFQATLPSSDCQNIVKQYADAGIKITTGISISTPPPENFGIPFVSLYEINSLEVFPQYVFANEHQIDMSFGAYFERMGITMLSLVSTNYVQQMYNAYMEHLPELYEVYSSFSDDISKKTFCDFLISRISRQVCKANIVSTTQYLCNGYLPQAGDICIDGGACDGATAAMFADMGAKVYAFEMDAENYNITNELAKKKKFVVEKMGLGFCKHKTHYKKAGDNIGGSYLSSDGETADIISLDAYAEEKNLPRIDYIKLDVEGSEMNVLRGAASSIVRWKPKMAVCVYHEISDIWELMLYIKSLRNDYEFAMRQFPLDVRQHSFCFDDNVKTLLSSYGLQWEMPTLGECVLFCR